MTTTRYTRSRTRREPHDVLGLSPLKHVTDPPDLVREVCSSPIREDSNDSKRKAVTFSKKLTTPMKYNNIGELRKVDLLQPKLILKSITTELPPLLISSRNYGDLNFWSPGLVVELPAQSKTEVQLLFDGAIRVLRQPQFDRRFEVYASLATVVKHNVTPELVRYLTKESTGSKGTPLTLITLLVRSDITMLAQECWGRDDVSTRNDPFQIRTMSQALRLITTFMSDEFLNCFLALDDVRWFYRQAATLLTRPLVSKALTLPLLQLLKDCKFPRSLRRKIFDNNEIIELMLMALINMQCFSSSTILSERVIAFYNYCIMFAPIMAKNAVHWVGPLVLSIITTAAQVPKSANVVVQTFTEICKVGEKHSDIIRALRDFLNQELNAETAELVVQLKLTNEAIEVEGQCGEDIVLQGLERLIELDRAKPALDLWVLLTLCLNKLPPKWRLIPHIAYQKDVTWESLRSWRVYVHLLGEKEGWNAEIIPRKLLDLADIVRGPLHWQPTPDLIHMNSLVMDTIYHTIHKCIALMTIKSLRGYWDAVIAPMMIDTFFKLNEQTALHGYRILAHLTLTAPIVPYSQDRIYSEEPIQIHEINCLPRLWIAKHAKSVAPLISQALLSLKDSARGLHLASQYLQSVSGMTTADEVLFICELATVINNILDICDSRPKFIEMLFQQFSPEAILTSAVFDKLFVTETLIHEVFSRIHACGVSREIAFSFLQRIVEHHTRAWDVFLDLAMDEPIITNLELYEMLIPFITSCKTFAKFIDWLLEQMVDTTIMDPIHWPEQIINHEDFSILAPYILGRLKDPSKASLTLDFINEYPNSLLPVVKEIYHIGTLILEDSLKDKFRHSWELILNHKANVVANSGSEYDCHMLDDLLCKSESETGVVLQLAKDVLARFPMYTFARMEPDEVAIDESESKFPTEDEGIEAILANTPTESFSSEGRVTRSKSRKVKGTTESTKKKRKAERRLKRTSTESKEPYCDSFIDPNTSEDRTTKRQKVANFKRLYEVLSTWSQEDSQQLTSEQKSTLEKMALEFMLSLKK